MLLLIFLSCRLRRRNAKRRAKCVPVCAQRAPGYGRVRVHVRVRVSMRMHVMLAYTLVRGHAGL